MRLGATAAVATRLYRHTCDLTASFLCPHYISACGAGSSVALFGPHRSAFLKLPNCPVFPCAVSHVCRVDGTSLCAKPAEIYRETLKTSFFIYIGILNFGSLKCGAGEGWRKISWTDRGWNEEVLGRDKEEINILHIVKRRKANWWVTSCVGTAV